MIGRIIGNYQIIELLGVGGMGTVFKGIDRMVEREVAVKVLRSDIAGQPDLLQRFRAEAVTLAKVSHPNVATLYSFFNEGDEYFMVMEFVPGRNLDEYVGQAGKLPLDKAVAIFSQAADGIAAAHQKGILHRDIKPANIMVTHDGVVKVMDFGIARALRSSRMTRDGRIVGTVEYMAPERIEGNEDDARSDVYSLGVVLYELLAGRLPFVSDSEFQIMRAHLSVQAPSVRELCADVPESIADAVQKALAKRPDERFSTASGFRDAVGAGLPDGVRPATAAQLAAAIPPSAAAKGDADPAPAVKATRMAGTDQPVAATRMAARPGRSRWSFPSLGWKHYAVAASVLLLLVVAGWAMLSRNAGQPVETTRDAAGASEILTDELGAPTGGPATGAGAKSGPSGLDEILSNSVPIEGEIPGIVTAGSVPPAENPDAVNLSELSPEERRRRALEALGVAEPPAAKGESDPDEDSSAERRRRALEALNQ